ncbi:MAG: hypothetical protein ACLR50_14450 [Segatella copri]
MALTLSSVCFLAFAQKTIQGTVKDANGDPMIGVTITSVRDNELYLKAL